MTDFEGRRVVITGAAGGVGRALVEVFSSRGAEVVACDRAEFSFPAGAVAESHQFDLLDDEAVARSVRLICEKGPPYAVISNAGATRAETLADVSPDALTNELNLNFRAAAQLCQAFLPDMRKRASGACFVFVSSINALTHFGNPAYSAAKAGILAWMRAIATEEGKNGIRANAVVPGSIRTNAWEHRILEKPGIMDDISKLYPLGRLVEPREVAQAVAFLASDQASGITGTELRVDAGLCAGNLPFFEHIARS